MTDDLRFDPSTHTVGLSLDLAASLVPDRPDPPIPVDGVTIGIAAMIENAPHDGEMHPDGAQQQQRVSSPRWGWMMRMIGVVVVGLWLAGPVAAEDAVEDFTWLADCWARDDAEAGSGEIWTPAAGGAMFGVGRTVAGGEVVAFEFMQIRRRDDGTAVFIAQPNGGAPVEFPLVESGDTRAVFENPAHDFPQRVIYDRGEGGVLLARIEGGDSAMDFPMHRVACDAREAYDPHLAAELGADDYGMHRYVMAFLKRGPNRDQSEADAAALMRAHLDNIQRLADAGQLVVAGPFLDDGEVRGIYIFNVETVEQARELTATDPAIQAGRLEMELHPWYGAAALQQLLDLYPRTTKQAP